MSNFDYYQFRIKNVTDKINEEIAFYQKSNYAKIYPVSTYLNYLESRIGLNKIDPLMMTRYDNSGNKHEIKKMNLEEYVKDMDILVFKKPWNKLHLFHKVMKIKEFIDSLEYGSKASKSKIDKNKEELKKIICNGLKEKRFNKHKSEVEYDQEAMQIQSISCLNYDKKTGLYEVDWDE